MRTGRESNQGMVFPASRYKKTPYDMRDLERVIVEMPNEIVTNITDLEESEKEFQKTGRNLFKEFNENRIAISGDGNHNYLIYLGVGGMLFTIIAQLINSYEIMWGLWITIAIPSIWPIYLGLNLSKDPTIAFDRENGTVELPGFLKEPPVVDKFENKFVRFSSDSGGFTDHRAWSVKVSRYNKAGYRNKPFALGRWTKGGWETWSYWVWYMDRNRPLPPGTAFDEYRNADFERRKSEGFPPPLYKSRILTPETTPEQQIERETYWKDEDYMVP